MADTRDLAPLPPLTRRAVLTSTVLGAGSALGLAACSATGSRAASASATPPTAAARGGRLFAQPDLDFEASFGLGSAAYGCSEIGEVLATVERINAAGASYETYVDGFSALARRLSARADAALSAAHRVSARSASLRAAHYHKQALFFILGTSRPAAEVSVYGAMQAQWDRAARLFDPPLERVQIPYEGTTLPGYFLAATPSGARRPTIILVNGSDGQNVDLWAYGGAAALERGYNALIVEGPGQGAMLFERQVPFRPDWEKVVTPVVDFLVARPEVDARRIGIVGWSMGGGLVARAAAFEPRLAAIVCDPATGDSWTAFPAPLRAIADAGGKEEVNRIWRAQILADLGPVDKFTLMKRTEIFGKRFQDDARAGRVTDDFHDLAQALKRYRYVDVLSRITAPVLLTDYEHEQMNAPGTTQRVYAQLRSPKTLIKFTAEEGAGLHDAPFAPQRRNEAIFDWFDRTLAMGGR